MNSTYQVSTLLSSDIDGQLYEAWDMLLERLVALRVSWRDPGVPPLLQHARAVGAIAHPCAADVYGMGNHHGSEYIVSERIEGLSLAEHIAAIYDTGREISVDTCVELVTKIADGLRSVHSAGLWIGHLRPESVVLTPTGRIVFTKFALGQQEVDVVEPECFAPEVLQGVATADHAACVAIDMYSLGLIAAQLLLGSDPHAGETLAATRNNHVNQRPPALSILRADVPTELSDLVEELLAKSPGKRPAAHDVFGQLRTISERQSSSRRILRVLIVDVRSDRVRTLWSSLRRAYSRTVVDAAHAVDDALTKLRRDKPDVLVVDLGFSASMNGFELCMLLQGEPAAKGCAMVAVSSDLKPTDVALLESMGIRHVLTRDALAGAVSDIVRELARGSRPAPVAKSPISG